MGHPSGIVAAPPTNAVLVDPATNSLESRRRQPTIAHGNGLGPSGLPFAPSQWCETILGTCAYIPALRLEPVGW